jgi:hypothetical protein
MHAQSDVVVLVASERRPGVVVLVVTKLGVRKMEVLGEPKGDICLAVLFAVPRGEVAQRRTPSTFKITAQRVGVGRAWTRTPSHSGPGVPGSIRRSKGVTALPTVGAAATLSLPEVLEACLTDAEPMLVDLAPLLA